MKTRILLFWCCMFSFVTLSRSQGEDSLSTGTENNYFRFDTTASLEFLFTLFPPFFIQNGIELKEFVRSDEFKQLRSAFGDTKAVDAIFVRSMQLTRNNTGISLFLATLASFDHRLINFDIPVFSLAIPLSDESEDEFIARVRNLPAKLFPDSPESRFGDRDKLQHFFGSAFITYVFESRGAANRVGYAIEHGEQAIIIGGVNDDRDHRANFLGQEFGLALMENPFRLPSEFLLHAIVLDNSMKQHNQLEDEYDFDSCR